MTDYEALARSIEQPRTAQTSWEDVARSVETTGTFKNKATIPGPGNPQIKRDPERGGGLGTAFVASFADDPNVRAAHFAAKRFPDLPIEDALRRYFVHEGEIAYKGDDGRYYSETPTAMGRVAGEGSKALPIAAGGVTAVGTAPLWLAGPGGGALAAELTGLAAGAGEGIRQGIGDKVLGDDPDIKEVGKEFLLGAGGELPGGLLARGLARGAARDIARISPEDVATLQQLSQKYGIDLTPAELTNLPSLKARQKAVGNLTDSADTMQDFYLRRAGQVDDAVGRELSGISPVDSADQAGMMARDAASGAIRSARRERSEAAAPLYAFVNDPQTVMSEARFSAIKSDDFLAKEIEKVKGGTLAGMAEYPDNSLPVIDQVKKNLDDQIAAANRSGERNKARLLGLRRDKLLKAADQEFPDYPLARASFAGDSPAVDELEGGIVGILSKIKDTRVQDAAKSLFDPGRSGPRQVAIAKTALKKSDPDAWQAVKRAYIEDMWQRSSKETMTNPGTNRGARFRHMLLGDKKQEVMLRTMLEPEEYKSLTDLSRVLEASGRVKQVGSDTAWNQELMKMERDEARPLLASIARKMRVASWPKMVEDWATERAVRENAKQMAHIITSPDGINSLKELRRLQPGSARAAVLSAYALGIGGRVGSSIQDPQSEE